MTTPQKALRSMYIYSCYDARDKLLGRGTAWELVESGLFGSETSIYSCYNKGGVNDRLGVARMTRVSEMRELQPKRKAAVHRKASRCGVSPTRRPYSGTCTTCWFTTKRPGNRASGN